MSIMVCEGLRGIVPRFIDIGVEPCFEMGKALMNAGCFCLGGGIVRCMNDEHAQAMIAWLEMEGVPAISAEDWCDSLEI